MRRYRVARALGKFDDVVEEDRQLLDRYGLLLMAVDCGVHVAVKDELRTDKKGKLIINPWNTLTLDEKTWGWLRPRLARLAELEDEAPTMMVAK